MHFITSLYKAFISIYSFILLVLFVITMVSCDNLSCSNNIRKEKKEKLIVDIRIPLKPHLGWQANNQFQKVDLKHSAMLSDSACPIKKVKKSKRVPKLAEDKQAIVLLHGLHRLSYDFDAMIAVLKEKFPHARIIALKSVDKDPNKKGWLSTSLSMSLSIKQQTQLALEEIIEKFPSGSHLVIVGHSQGGLRGFSVAHTHMKDLKEHRIIPKKLITIGTPWKGAPILARVAQEPELVIDKIQAPKIKNTLDAINRNYSSSILKYFFKISPLFSTALSGIFYKRFINLKYVKEKLPGCEDLKPASTFIKDVAQALKSFDLPITAIAGVLTDFSQLFDQFPSTISHQALAELNVTYAELIGGHPNSEHDMLLPVDTQHAEGLPVKNFKRIKVYGACHGNKVGVSVKRCLSELNNKKVIEKVVESIEEAFYEYKEEMVTKSRAAPAVAA